jgi:hypothetical protein
MQRKTIKTVKQKIKRIGKSVPNQVKANEFKEISGG